MDEKRRYELIPVERSDAKPAVSSKKKHRPEIQGLRGIAIAAVLLFHSSPARFPFGYLGVDVFFVISGYLMCAFLTREEALDSRAISVFYFRRVRRIVPLYAFVITSVLFGCFLLISPLEFEQVAEEVVPSLFFFSNIPAVHETPYFDPRSKHRFLLHTWSLSTELQFYLLAPFLVQTVRFLMAVHSALGFMGMSVAISASFFFQSTSVDQHLLLEGRIWEFLFGFVAFYVHKSRIVRMKATASTTLLFRSLFQTTRFVLPLLLVCFLLFAFFSNPQIQRLFVVLLTTFILCTHKSEVLSAYFLVQLGDASYSIYLVHWPLFTFCRYFEVVGEGGSVYFYLISLSILLGYAIEWTFGWWAAGVQRWRQLLTPIAALYAVSFVLLVLMRWNSERLINDSPLTPTAETERLQTGRKLWESRRSEVPFSPSELLELNEKIAYPRLICGNRSRVLPTRSRLPLDSIKHVCHERGSGQKTIVILGNSHASFSFAGVAEQLKPIAKTIVLLSTPRCTPLFEWQKMDEKGKKKCRKFIRTMIEVLKSWKGPPIDAILPLFGYVEMEDPPLQPAGENEPLTFLEFFFADLSSIARDLVFVPSLHLRFSSNPLWKLREDLRTKKTIGIYGQTRKQVARFPHLTARLERVRCPKCVAVDWRELWCDPPFDGFCYSVDPNRELAFFLDTHHLTLYGSMAAGHFLKEIYVNHTSFG